uniref:Uncharacterized protein n=1 Tax=Oryza glumipatula TaxID=40148 RepID=A0A0D9Y3Q1_9ORYZ
MSSFRISGGTATWLIDCFDCPRGLVLVDRPCEGYSVCNPTTGEILRLPSLHRPHCATAMGFNAPGREFKMVYLSVDEVGKLDTIVLTVGDAQGWRAPAAGNHDASIVVGFTDDAAAASIDSDVQPVFADGFLHWIDLVLVDWNGDYRLLRAKVIRSESGEEVAVPVGKTLTELDDRLCMVRDVRHRSDVGGLLLKIWKLQDYDTGS